MLANYLFVAGWVGGRLVGEGLEVEDTGLTSIQAATLVLSPSGTKAKTHTHWRYIDLLGTLLSRKSQF